MSVKKSWLDALKETVEERPQTLRKDSGKPTSTTVQNMRKPRGVSRGKVAHINTARPVRHDPDERRLIAAGWTPKDRCGPLELTIWANPETGFYCSQEVALHRLDRDAGGAS